MIIKILISLYYNILTVLHGGKYKFWRETEILTDVEISNDRIQTAFKRGIWFLGGKGSVNGKGSVK